MRDLIIRYVHAVLYHYKVLKPATYKVAELFDTAVGGTDYTHEILIDSFREGVLNYYGDHTMLDGMTEVELCMYVQAITDSNAVPMSPLSVVAVVTRCDTCD